MFNHGRYSIKGTTTTPQHPELFAALQHFENEILSGINRRIQVYIESQKELGEALDDARTQADVANSTIESVRVELALAKLLVQESDTEHNRGEVRRCEAELKCAETKLATQQQRCEKYFTEWRAHVNDMLEKQRAARSIAAHFKHKEKRILEGKFLLQFKFLAVHVMATSSGHSLLIFHGSEDSVQKRNCLMCKIVQRHP
jgi:hypothetical protein